ncbi:MAG: DAK2 domain-containing protein [Acidimicrobiales bacterium]
MTERSEGVSGARAPASRPTMGSGGAALEQEMPPLERLRAADLQATLVTYRDALGAHRETINRLNVYPVPDGDTGTNMARTVAAVCEELDRAGAPAGDEPGAMAATCTAIAHGSLMGARGNSGVILSQILRGMTEVLRDHDEVGADEVAEALARAAAAAYGAVMKPVEGTILTVVREASEAAVAATGDGLLAVLEAARSQGGDALARTPELLAVLAQAGVVDAGGAGFLLLLDALLHTVAGRPVPEPDLAVDALDDAAPESERPVGGTATLAELRYEVMYLLEAPDGSMPAFKDVWAGIGDSIVVVGGDGMWNCHIHTDDIGAAIEAAIDVGRPCKIRVTDLLEEVEEERWVREAAVTLAEEAPHADVPVACAVVAVSTGAGVRRILHSLGVQRIVTGGQSMNPSTAELLAEVESAPAPEVVLLPNNKNVIPVAEQVAAHATKTVLVVPTRGIAEGLAALVAYDPEDDAAANAATMGDAAAGVVAGEITRAVRDSSSDAGPINEGDWLGITRSGITVVDPALDAAATRLLDELVGDDHEIVTVIEGDGAGARSTRRITEWLREHRHHVEVEVHHGGQPLYPYLFGVE